MMKIILYVVAAIMLLMTAIAFDNGLAKFLIASGSDVLMTLVESHLSIRISLVLIFIASIVFYKKYRRNAIYYFFLTAIFILWLFSGRMIAFFPDGRLISGWFYMETSRVYVCKENSDCEKIFNETKHNKKMFWRYKIINSDVSEVVFVGPFIFTKVDSLFSSSFHSLQR